MKILIATFTFAPNKDGVAAAAAAAATAFQTQGWEVEVATGPAGTPRSSNRWGRGRIFEFRITGTPYFRHPFRGEISEYLSFLKHGRWDVIVFQGYSWPLYLAAPHLEKISGKKVLVSHGYNALIWTPVKRPPFGLCVFFHSVLQSILMLRWIHKIDRWVFLSSQKDFGSFYDHWLARRISHPGITIIPNGVNENETGSGESFRRSLGIGPDILVILCVGYFSQGKNQGMAVQAFRRANLREACLVFIGPEPNEWMRRFQESDLGLDPHAPSNKVFWITRQSRQYVLDAFAGCDLYLSASVLEAQPMSILEAMAHGKPWVGQKAGCIPNLPGGICVRGLGPMVRALKQLALSPELRRQLGREGLQAAKLDFSRGRYEKSYCDLVRSLATHNP